MKRTVINPSMQAKGCMIWLHGLGADGSDMQGVVAALSNELPFKHVFLDAPLRPVTINAGMNMPAWYDILGLSAGSREDKSGIVASHNMLLREMTYEMDAGFNSHDIILAGFSQGGAMALYTGLHAAMGVGGIVSLSAYLPLASEASPMLSKDTPIFLGLGQKDPVVLPDWTRLAKDYLVNQGYQHVMMKEYAMEHQICQSEIIDLNQWLSGWLEGEFRA